MHTLINALFMINAHIKTQSIQYDTVTSTQKQIHLSTNWSTYLSTH